MSEHLHEHLLPCVMKQATGLDCLGCGMQRSFLALLEGDLAGSISLYPALLPMLALFALLGGHLIFKWKHGAALLQWWFIGTLGLAVTSWLYKVWPVLFN